MNRDNVKFEALFQYASIGILVADISGTITLANNFLISLFGYENAEEIVGKKIEQLIPSRYHKHHVKDRSNYTKNPQKRPMGLGMDLFAKRKDDSEFAVEVSLSNYTTAEGDFAIAFVSDITKRKEIETAIKQQKEELAANNLKIEELNNELEQKVEFRTAQLQQTMAELERSKEELTNALSKEKELSDLKSRFVSMASHEFRTPLSTILSSASLLAKYTATEEQDKRDRHIHRIKSAVSNLDGILNEFLSLGKIEDGKIIVNNVEFDVSELINNILEELRPICKQGQEIIYTHSGNERISLDVNLLRNILINLVSNALKFSPEKSIIKIESNADEDRTVIKISDSGLGISVSDQKHLFGRFFRGANVANIQGTGLGLHIVQRYIDLMNGEITFKSKLGKGTIFTIAFKKEHSYN